MQNKDSDFQGYYVYLHPPVIYSEPLTNNSYEVFNLTVNKVHTFANSYYTLPTLVFIDVAMSDITYDF